MSRLCLPAVVAALLLLAACGARPATAHRDQAGPARLAWKVGETFTGAVSFDERDSGTVDDELRFSAHQRFRVIKVKAGVATIRVAVTSWVWQRNTSELLTASLPETATFSVDAGAEIRSGVDWPLPSELPVPGLDVFAAPLGSSTGWSRTDGDGVGLSYQAQADPEPGTQAFDWSVVRPVFTVSGDPITISGRCHAVVSSRYQRRGATETLRSTHEQATFERTARSAAGTTQETGAILETTVFSAPSP